ncbi:TetR/AcrR family transcriptional regulator [Nocardia brasiliensis]
MQSSDVTNSPTRSSGRGARQRILNAAAQLFYENGIHATGIARLVEVADVSTRTFYQHFPSKQSLVEAYLAEFDRAVTAHIEQHLAGVTRGRDQLIAMFTMLAEDPLTPSARALERGCPFHNAAVEAAGDMPGIAELVHRYKNGVTQRLTDIAAEADAPHPEALGRRLALLIEGATAMSTSLGTTQPLRDARDAAQVLIDQSLPPAGKLSD